MTLMMPYRRSRRREVHQYVIDRYDRYGPGGSLEFAGDDGDEVVPAAAVRLAQAERTLTAWRDGLIARHHARRNHGSIVIRVVCGLILAVGVVALFAACGAGADAPVGGSMSNAASGSHEAAVDVPAPAVATADFTPAPLPARALERTAGELLVAGDATWHEAVTWHEAATWYEAATLYEAATETVAAGKDSASVVLAAVRLDPTPAPAAAVEAPPPPPPPTPEPQPVVAAPAPTSTPEPIVAQPSSTPQPDSTAATIEQMAPQPAPAPAVGTSAYEGALLAGLNAERTRHGLAPFALSGPITEIARHRSRDMSANAYFAHKSPSGETWISLLSAAGIRLTTGGENLARVSGDAARASSVAVEKLMQSPTHRANILNASFARIGVGAATDADGVTVFTTIFAD